MLDSSSVRNSLPKLRDDNQLLLVCSRRDSQICPGEPCRSVSGNHLRSAHSLDSGNLPVESRHLDKEPLVLGCRFKLPLLFDCRCSVGRSLFFRSLLTISLFACLLMTQPGCSLMVMASKVLMGDPKVPSLFGQRTGIDFIEDEKTVLIVSTTPEFLRLENSAVDRDITEGVYRRFRRKEIRCISPSKVDGWLGRVGGLWEDPSEIAQEFEADYIIHFDLDSISYKEENSIGFYRGKAHGQVKVYAVREVGGQRGAFLVFEHEYTSAYPNHYPISSDNMSQRAFAEKFTKRISNELARLFYDYRSAEAVD